MKNLFYCFIGILMGPYFIAAASWDEILEEKGILSIPKYQILKQQFILFKEGQLPKIADPCIKEIVIEENDEPLMDVREMLYSRIKLMPDPETPFEGPKYNAGFLHSGKMRAGVYEALLALLKSLDVNAKEFGY
jgi:hypothetical protein